jgi:hypothetical protein
MRLPFGRSLPVAALLFLVSLPARAQDPVRLPGVNVTATIDKPGPRLLVGIVVDTAGKPIQGAEVIVHQLRRRLYTRADGTFRLDSIPLGKYEMRARKIGFAAQVREFVVDSTGGVAQFALVPIIQALPAMLSSANRKGISGYVADLSYDAIPKATVRVLGAGLSTETDSAGNFFLPAETGRYMVSIAKDSFTTRLVAVTVPKDSGRHVNAWLMPGTKVPKDEFWNVEDLRERQAWVRSEDRVLYTREDLVRINVEWIYDAVAMTNTKFRFTERFSRDCMVVVNGGPDIADLSKLTIDDVESIEVYRSFPTSPTSSAVNARGPLNSSIKAEFLTLAQSNTRFARFENQTRVCPGVYVWLR